MKLEEFSVIPVIEVAKGPDQPLGLNDPDLLTKLKPTGKNIEGYDLSALQIKDQIIFALIDNNQILSVLIGTLIEDFPDARLNTLRVDRSWTPEQFRNKGYSTALYDGLPRNGYRIVSDLQLSNASLSVWKKLGTKRELKYFDWDSKQYTDKDPVTNPTVSFVLEFTGYHHYNTLIKENVMFTGSSDPGVD